MKRYFLAINLLSFVAIVGGKLLMIKEYCLLSIAQGHAFFGVVRCLKLCDNMYRSLYQEYKNIVTASGYVSYLVDSVMPTLF